MVRVRRAIMLGFTESKITIEVPDADLMTRNITELVRELEQTLAEEDPPEEQTMISDVWVGIILALLILTCTACICSCLLYHRFQKWKRRELEARLRASASAVSVESGDRESLPSYSVVSGLPSYEEALEQLKTVKQVQEIPAEQGSQQAVQAPALSRLSVAELLMIYKQQAMQNDKS